MSVQVPTSICSFVLLEEADAYYDIALWYFLSKENGSYFIVLEHVHSSLSVLVFLRVVTSVEHRKTGEGDCLYSLMFR